MTARGLSRDAPAPLSAVVTAAARRLADAGWRPDDARRDAEILARHLLNLDQSDWLARQRETAPAQFHGQLDTLIRRRLAHEPIAYVVGSREFYGRPFRVTRDVLIPRPETEHVVEEALGILKDGPSAARATVLDVGTGSGCIAVTLALEAANVQIVATDISRAALSVAEANAEALGAASRVTFVHTSVADEVAGGVFDLVVSNPPYIATSDAEHLMPDVRDYEPASALFGGSDGLDIIRALVPTAVRRLRSGGWLVMEIGAGQAPQVASLIEGHPDLSLVRVVPDLAGIPLVALVRRR